MKIKNKNLRKYKNKKFFFFKSKLEQEIKIRKKPGKSGKIRKNPEKSKNPHKKSIIFC